MSDKNLTTSELFPAILLPPHNAAKMKDILFAERGKRRAEMTLKSEGVMKHSFKKANVKTGQEAQISSNLTERYEVKGTGLTSIHWIIQLDDLQAACERICHRSACAGMEVTPAAYLIKAVLDKCPAV